MVAIIPQGTQGLLSRIGAGGAFTTDAFFSAIQPDPTTGTLLFPRVEDEKLIVEPLTDARIPEAGATVAAFLAEAAKIGPSPLSRKSSSPLPSTEGRWTLSRRIRSDSFFVRSTSGRYVDSLEAPYCVRIGVAGSGRHAAFNQYVMIEKRCDEFISTRDYLMTFRGQEGLAALATYLGLAAPSMATVALRIANVIYAAVQDTRDEVMPPPSLWAPDCGNFEPEADDGRWKFPSAFRHDGKNVLIKLAVKSSSTGSIHYGLVVDSASGGRWGDLIIVSLQRFDDAPHLMPLRPELLPLWEGAMRLVDLDPDDGGYMVESM